jgi:proteasome lid subunit RPN8/RPN11
VNRDASRADPGYASRLERRLPRVVTFSFSSVQTIEDQARRFPGIESGGLLAGVGTSILFALPARNWAPDPTSEFAMDPLELTSQVTQIEVHKVEGLTLLGSYHSHPNGRADLSAADVALAERTGLLLIVAPGAAWQWRVWNPRAGGEVEAAIAWPNASPFAP